MSFMQILIFILPRIMNPSWCKLKQKMCLKLPN